MPRINLTKTTPLGTRSDGCAADLTMEAADASNKNQFAASGKDLVIAHNTGASPYTVTITNLDGADSISTYSLAAGEIAIFGPFDLTGWCEADWKIYLEASNAAVKFGVLDLSKF